MNRSALPVFMLTCASMLAAHQCGRAADPQLALRREHQRVPRNPDSDGDGSPDGDEYERGRDPLLPEHDPGVASFLVTGGCAGGATVAGALLGLLGFVIVWRRRARARP